jgi:hypothetical protein
MPHYVYIGDGKGAYIQRGPYLSSRKAESKQEAMEAETGREAEVRYWSTWDPNRAKKNWRDELLDRVGVEKGMQRFSSGKGITKDRDAKLSRRSAGQ